MTILWPDRNTANVEELEDLSIQHPSEVKTHDVSTFLLPSC